MKPSVVIGITGGIAAVKTPEIIQMLQSEGIDVEVILTHSATKILRPEEIEKIIKKKIYVDLFEKDIHTNDIRKNKTIEHISLAKKANLFIVVPATANILSKLAYGMADDFLTTTLLATKAPVMIFPSMNTAMWENPLTKENVTKLKSIGYEVVDPNDGMLACGDIGPGRLAEPSEVAQRITDRVHATKRLAGKRIIVTMGGTRDYIDDVRFITNKSSGKMGAAIAEECFQRGADILVLRAITSVKPRFSLNEELFETAEELETLIKKYAADYDVLFHTAAVSDYTVNKQSGKLDSAQKIRLELTPREKILSKIKHYNSDILLVGFKAVWNKNKQEQITEGEKKLQETGADAIIVNDVSSTEAGFGSDKNEVVIVSNDKKPKEIGLDTKTNIARSILDSLTM
ncbi:MAG: bifunctional phosphopantothenoylcysteine decarboxylase/phosphopantothenate--cysteine ligase CoaBC [Candidatus Levyibacteriota bacterium]